MLTEEDKRWIEENLKQRIQENLKPFESLMTNLFHSFEGEMRMGFRGINTRFDTQSTRLERHAGLLQTGSRAIQRLHEWSEKVDRAMEEKDRQITEIQQRLNTLEQAKGDQ